MLKKKLREQTTQYLTKTATYAENGKSCFIKTPCHPIQTAVTMLKIHELRFDRLDHPPYLQDLPPNEIFLFSHLKIALTFVIAVNYVAEKNAWYYLEEEVFWVTKRLYKKMKINKNMSCILVRSKTF